MATIRWMRSSVYGDAWETHWYLEKVHLKENCDVCNPVMDSKVVTFWLLQLLKIIQIWRIWQKVQHWPFWAHSCCTMNGFPRGGSLQYVLTVRKCDFMVLLCTAIDMVYFLTPPLNWWINYLTDDLSIWKFIVWWLRLRGGGGGGGGGALGYRGGPHPRYIFRGRRGLFKTSACTRFCKRRVLFCTQVRSMGVKVPLQYSSAPPPPGAEACWKVYRLLAEACWKVYRLLAEACWKVYRLLAEACWKVYRLLAEACWKVYRLLAEACWKVYCLLAEACWKVYRLLAEACWKVYRLLAEACWNGRQSLGNQL